MSKFYQGKPCKEGHTKRYTANNHCVECRSNMDHKEVNYWSLSHRVVTVPNVNKLFWAAMPV